MDKRPRVRRIEKHNVFTHYAHRSLSALLQLRPVYDDAWPWRDAVLCLSFMLGSEDPRVAAYCTKAWDAGMAVRSPEEGVMDCMEFCSRRVSELLALQAIEILDVPRVNPPAWSPPPSFDALKPTTSS
jgi:hypothetical protein